MTEYVYKHYIGYTYIGILNNVVSNFNFTQDINTAFSQLVIELGISFENSDSTITSESLVDENSVSIISESGEDIVISTSLVLGSIPSLNDRIEVWEINDLYPDGRVVFNGLVSKWISNYDSDTVIVTLLSYGVQLDNYLVQILPTESVAGLDISNYDSTEVINVWPTGSQVEDFAQTFTVATDVEIYGIQIYAKSNDDRAMDSRLRLIRGTISPINYQEFIADITPHNITTEMGVETYQFSTPVLVTASTDYFFSINGMDWYGSERSLSVACSSIGGYVDGAKYAYRVDGTKWSAASGDLIFNILAATPGTTFNQFNSCDPSDIVRILLDNFIQLGGNLTYTDDSIQDTNTIVSYTFKFVTYYEALQKCIELAPANWYWYVDRATNIVYFKPKPIYSSHTLIKDKHINSMCVEQSLEDVVNNVYFSGGDVAGTNLQVNNNNSISINSYGQWLKTVSDNRVILSDSAYIMINAILNQKSEPKFKVSDLVISSKDYDISTFVIGQLVNFSNSNIIVNQLEQQIMSIEYTPDYVTLKLEVLPPTQSKRLEDIKRNLSLTQTENNPSSI